LFRDERMQIIIPARAEGKAPDRRMTPKLRSFIDFAITAFGQPSS